MSRIFTLLVFLLLSQACTAEIVWEYQVELQADQETLVIQSKFARGARKRLSLQTGVEDLVSKVELRQGRNWIEIPQEGDSWYLSGDGPYELRYRFAVSQAVDRLDDWRFASRSGQVMIAQPGVWMLRPLGSDPGDEVRFKVKTVQPYQFVSGIAKKGDWYRIPCRKLAFAPLSAFGPFRLERLQFPKGEVLIALDPAQFTQSPDELVAWVSETVREIQHYLRGLPVPRTFILMISSSRTQGRVQGDGGASLALRVSRSASVEELKRDWKLRHEMLHLAHPSLPEHRWFEEGLAVYTEFALRLSSGYLSPVDFWSELTQRLPDAQTEPLKSLDDSDEHDRIYWGGTLYFLLVDLQIRQESQNQRSVHDAIRSFHTAGGNVSVTWPLSKVLSQADKASQTTAFSSLYRELGQETGLVDLDGLWESLKNSQVKKWVESGDQS